MFCFASILPKQPWLLQMSCNSVMVPRPSIDRKILCKITFYDKTAENMEMIQVSWHHSLIRCTEKLNK